MSAAVVVYRRCLRYEFCICFMPLVISTSRCLNITESQVLKTFSVLKQLSRVFYYVLNPWICQIFRTSPSSWQRNKFFSQRDQQRLVCASRCNKYKVQKHELLLFTLSCRSYTVHFLLRSNLATGQLRQPNILNFWLRGQVTVKSHFMEDQLTIE